MAATVAGLSSSKTDLDKRIPVIKAVFTDKDINCRDRDKRTLPKLPPPNIEKVLKLLTDKHSRALTNRHNNAIKRISNYYENGFYLKDFRTITSIVTTCTERTNVDSVYENCVIDLLKCLRCPLLKEKMSDEDTYMDTTINCISEIGKSVESTSENVILHFANSLRTLYTWLPKGGNVDIPDLELKPVTPEFLKAIIERSMVSCSLTVCLNYITNMDVRLEVMHALKLLSDSTLNCDDMLTASAASLICTAINFPAPNKQLLFLSVEVLWNLLENGSTEEVMKQLDCDECINALKEAFLDQVESANSLADRQVRNDLLVIQSLIMTGCPKAPFVATGVTQVLSLLASYPEVHSRSELVKNFKLQDRYEDFELKKLLFSILVALSRDTAAIPVLMQEKVLLALFSYVQPIDSNLQTHWAPAQFEELQLLALSVLSTLGPLCVDEYMVCQGNTRLLLLIEWCLDLGGFGGHGNSFHGTGGRGSKRAQMRYTVRLIRSMVTTQDEQILQDLCDQGAVGQFVNILHSATSSDDENDNIDIEMQCDMLFVLAILCEGDNHRKELFGEQGVHVLINYLKTRPEKILSIHGHRRLVLASVDCIWSAVLGCYLNETVFLEQEGLFLLLDLLELCPSNMQGMLLGSILDFCENPKALPHVKLWRGEEETTVGKLLIEMWKKEEERLGVQRGDTGIIQDSSQPILSKVQEKQGIFPLPSSYPSPAIVDVSENIRAKIYSFFCKIGFNNVPGLRTEDYVTLAVIEQYLEFKTLEVWREIKMELEQERIRPVSPDIQCIESVIQILEDRALSVASVQGMLVEADAKQLLADEDDWIRQIQESHSQEEKAYCDFVDFIQRTSDISVLQAAREKQLHAIERSRMHSRGGSPQEELAHETSEKRLQTTTFCGRQLAVQSTPSDIVRTAWERK